MGIVTSPREQDFTYRNSSARRKLSCDLSYIMSYFCMNVTLTIRLPKEQREALRKRAAILKKSESDLVRMLITRGLSEESILDQVASLVGSLDSSKRIPTPNPLRRRIRDRNWRK